MAKGILSKPVLDVLNRAAEIKSEIDFCDEGGGLQSEMYHFAEMGPFKQHHAGFNTPRDRVFFFGAGVERNRRDG